MNYDTTEILHAGVKAVIVHLNTKKTNDMSMFLGWYPVNYIYLSKNKYHLWNATHYNTEEDDPKILKYETMKNSKHTKKHHLVCNDHTH
jgi:hypothetical protein